MLLLRELVIETAASRSNSLHGGRRRRGRRGRAFRSLRPGATLAQSCVVYLHFLYRLLIDFSRQNLLACEENGKHLVIPCASINNSHTWILASLAPYSGLAGNFVFIHDSN